jgi:hypothetical protein
MASYRIEIAGEAIGTMADGAGALEAGRAAAKALAGSRVGSRVEIRDAHNGRRVGLYAAQSIARVEVRELHEPDFRDE